MKHPIETFFVTLRKWLAQAQRHDPGLQDAEVARRFAERERVCHAEVLEAAGPETALRTTALILTSRPELLN